MVDREKSVAVRMPDIGANTNNGNILSPPTSATGKKAGIPFSALLAQATDNSQPTLPRPEIGNLTTRRIAPAKTTRRTASASRDNLAKTNGSSSLLRGHARPGEANAAPDKAVIVDAQAKPETETPLAVAAPVTSDPLPTDAARVLPLKAVTRNTETGPTAAESAKAPTVAAPRAFNLESLNPVTNLGPTAEESAKVPTVAAPRAPNVELLNPVASPEARSFVAEPMKAPDAVARGTAKDQSLSPIANAPKGPRSAESVNTPTVLARGTSSELLSRVSPAKSGDVFLGTTASPVKSSVGENPAEPADDATPSFANLVPDSQIWSAAQNTTKSDAGISAIHDYKALVMAQGPVPQQKALIAEGVSKVITDVPAPVRQIDRESTYVPQIHKQSKQIANLPSDTNHAAQLPQPVKEGAKADDHQVAPANLRASTSDRGSHPSSNDKSEHGSKPQGEVAAAQASDVATRGTQQGKGIPATDTRNGFPDVMASQVLGASVAKENSSLFLSPRDSAQPHDGAATQSSKPTEIDRNAPHPLIGDSLGTLHSAKLVAQAGQSELRVGFQAGEFGNVNIRTSMVRNQVTAQISVEHSELRNLLAVELPHLQTKLAEHPLTATNIVLNNYAGGNSSGSRHAYQQNAHVLQGSSSRPDDSSHITSLPTVAEAQTSSTQLDVHM